MSSFDEFTKADPKVDDEFSPGTIQEVDDEFSPGTIQEVDDEFDAWESDSFGNLDIDNLPQFTDGTTHRMYLSEIKLFTPEEQSENPLMHKVRMSVVWSVADSESIFAGESVTQFFDLYPKFRLELSKVASDIVEVKKAAKKLKRDLRDPIKYTGSFHPRTFQSLYLNMLADVEIRVNYSEKAEKYFANVQSISPVADDGSDTSWSGKDY